MVTIGVGYYWQHKPDVVPKIEAPVLVAAPKAMKKIALSQEQLFGIDSFVLKQPTILQPIITILKEQPKSNAKIIGYTDNTGRAAYNLMLSQRRAQAVANYIESQGIMAQRLIIKGEGEISPIAMNNTVLGRAKNRRVEITLLNVEDDK
jgi:OOP family OmpA-OmpF porin